MFISASPLDTKSTLLKEMAWHQIDAKPLPEPMMTQITYALDLSELTHWGRVARMCIIKLTVI